MPHETTQQPFTGDKPRSTDDKKLVGQVLGDEAADEMDELVGETKKYSPPETTPNGLELSESEQGTVNEIEKIYTPDERKQQYLEWASENGIGEDFIKMNFDFQDNGDVHTRHNLDFYNIHLKRLPPGLTLVKGNLYMTSPETVPDLNPLKDTRIQEALYINSCDIDKVPRGIKCGRIKISYDGAEETDSECRKKGEELRKLGYTKINYERY